MCQSISIYFLILYKWHFVAILFSLNEKMTLLSVMSKLKTGSKDSLTINASRLETMMIVLSQIIPLSISTWFFKYRVSLDFFSISNSKTKSISKQTQFFVEFEFGFYCLCSLQKSSSNSTKYQVCLEIDFFSSL